MLKSTQTIKKKTTTEKKDFFFTNFIKRHKVTDLIRPNKLGTTISKATTKEHRHNSALEMTTCS
jgi:hypothetical protein